MTNGIKKFLGFLLVAVLSASVVPNPALADDGKDRPSPQPISAKPEAPQPGLTERERMLLDRVEQLERRVAELESKTQPATPGVPAATVESKPPTAGTAMVASVATSADPNSIEIAKNPGPTVSRQAVEKGKSAAGAQEKAAPFAFADFTWLNGNARTKEVPLDTKFFTPEIRADVDYIYDFHHPKDNTIGGSSEVFRANEVQVTQMGIGGDFHYDNVRARVMTQFGMYSQTTPRNDASPSRGQWNLSDAFRYVSEAYGGYHFNALNGINVDAGIFMSYVGLFSYYNFDNWAYQPSYVSSNTPWFFNGLRIQFFPTEKLKIEPWIVNGWQSYGKFNSSPGLGLQVLWRPTGWLSVLGNQYFGADTLGIPDRLRFHSDDSIQVKYLDDPKSFLSKAAFTFTFDIGCEWGGGVSCFGGDSPSQFFVGFMVYNRLWFAHDHFAVTLGGGGITNPGRYLVLLPPINGATAS